MLEVANINDLEKFLNENNDVIFYENLFDSFAMNFEQFELVYNSKFPDKSPIEFHYSYLNYKETLSVTISIIDNIYSVTSEEVI
jgi:hypothetical protein